MKLKVTRADVWAATIEDRVGGLADVLEPLAKAKVNLEFVISRRAPDQPGKGVVFVTPIKTAKQQAAASAAGFTRTANMHTVRVEGPDKPGLGAAMSRALASAGLNLRGMSAAVIGRKSVSYIALDSAEDAAKAMQVLKKLSAADKRA
jgi:hypothetical protein